MQFEDGEYVINIAHKHWFIFAVRAFTMFVVALLPLIILPVMGYFYNELTGQIFELFTFAYCLYLLFVWSMLFVMWTDYYLDMAVITNFRIMDVEQKNLFNREVSTLRYEMIQDITTDTIGVIPTLLNYGDLYVQTAAANREFCINNVSDPAGVKEIILREMNKRIEGKV